MTWQGETPTAGSNTMANLNHPSEQSIRADEHSRLAKMAPEEGLLTDAEIMVARINIDRVDIPEGYIISTKSEISISKAQLAKLWPIAQAKIEAERERAEELKQIFDMRHAADMRAIKHWRKGHPERKLCMPDHADMVVWLLEQLEQEREKTLKEVGEWLNTHLRWYDTAFFNQTVRSLQNGTMPQPPTEADFTRFRYLDKPRKSGHFPSESKPLE